MSRPSLEEENLGSNWTINSKEGLGGNDLC